VRGGPRPVNHNGRSLATTRREHLP
jgi:hypothetical protein